MSPADITKTIYELTNQQRKLNSLPLLKYAGCLERSALLHSTNMAKYNFFSHTDPVNISLNNLLKRIHACNGNYQIVGENLALFPRLFGTIVKTIEKEMIVAEIFSPRFGQLIKTIGGLAEDIVDGWMNSPGHRENILKPEFSFIGIGTVFTQKYVNQHSVPYAMVTQNFGGY